MSRTAILILALLAGLTCFVYAQTEADPPLISVLDFAAANISAAETRVLSDVLATYIVRTGAYRVIDRDQRETILEEIEFSYSDCTDRSCQLEIGRLLSASQLVTGSIGRIGGWLVVTVRVVDVSTGETLGSVSQRYLTLELMIEGLADLARQTVEAGGEEIRIEDPPTARALVTSARREQLEKQLPRLQRRVDEAMYARWLEEKNFAEYESDAPIEEKIEFLQEYRIQTNTHGHSLDLTVGYVAVRGEEKSEDGSYSEIEGGMAGSTLSWTYQFSNRLSAGAFVWIGVDHEKIREHSPPPLSQVNDRVVTQPALIPGGIFVFGDKTTSFAFLAGTGIGIGWGVKIPIRCGLYFRNFYLGYFGTYTNTSDGFGHGAEVGYSLFLGRRKTWPPERS